MANQSNPDTGVKGISTRPYSDFFSGWTAALRKAPDDIESGVVNTPSPSDLELLRLTCPDGPIREKTPIATWFFAMVKESLAQMAPLRTLPRASALEKASAILSMVAQCQPSTSLKDVVEKAASILGESATSLDVTNIVLRAVAWLTMLVSPFDDLGSMLNSHVASETGEDCLSVSIADFLLAVSGPVIDHEQTSAASSRPSQKEGPTNDALHVSYINAESLRELGGINIEWVYRLDEHLSFDINGRKLRVFCLPSSCKLHESNKGLISRIYDNLYDEWSKPDQFTTRAYMAEVLLSYRLLFADDRKARKEYCRLRKQILRAQGLVDPVLDDYCGMSRGSDRNYRNSYSILEDFPLLSHRLLQVQDDNSAQQVNQLRLILKDRRDVLRRWTFLAVIIFGCAGVIIGLMQLAAGILQTVYSARAQ